MLSHMITIAPMIPVHVRGLYPGWPCIPVHPWPKVQPGVPRMPVGHGWAWLWRLAHS